MNDPEFEQFLCKARAAATCGEGAWRVQSTGERLAVALALNRPEWLAKMDYTIPQAISRVGARWISMVPEIERIIRREQDTRLENSQPG